MNNKEYTGQENLWAALANLLLLLILSQNLEWLEVCFSRYFSG